MAQRLLILADVGGSNSCRSRVWQVQLQEHLCDASGLAVTVCNYQHGCSQWNPIEHRLFSFISMNWAGKPLHSFDLMAGYIASTETRTGLTVTVRLQRGACEAGERITDDEIGSCGYNRGPCARSGTTLCNRAYVRILRI